MSEEVCVEGGREGLVEQKPQARHICGGGVQLVGRCTCTYVGGTVS